MLKLHHYIKESCRDTYLRWRLEDFLDRRDFLDFLDFLEARALFKRAARDLRREPPSPKNPRPKSPFFTGAGGPDSGTELEEGGGGLFTGGTGCDAATTGGGGGKGGAILFGGADILSI
jgi:hypothetical protein